ncbi:MAG: transcription antitermination protein NusB [Aaplasma endosymbiont of Hyalomma asiaticum]
MEEEINEKANSDIPWHISKTSARFLAVQGAYVTMFCPYNKSCLQELLDYLCEMQNVMELHRVDKKLLGKILEYLLENKQEIEDLITRHISEKWAIDRINLVSLSVIKAGICELLCSKTDENIVINEYAGIASVVLEDGEINFVNAILNKAKSVRALLCNADGSSESDSSGCDNGCSGTSREVPEKHDASLAAAGNMMESAVVPTAPSGNVGADLLTV